MCFSQPKTTIQPAAPPPKTLDQSAPKAPKGSSDETGLNKAAMGSKKYRTESSLTIPSTKTQAATGYNV